MFVITQPWSTFSIEELMLSLSVCLPALPPLTLPSLFSIISLSPFMRCTVSVSRVLWVVSGNSHMSWIKLFHLEVDTDKTMNGCLGCQRLLYSSVLFSCSSVQSSVRSFWRSKYNPNTTSTVQWTSNSSQGMLVLLFLWLFPFLLFLNIFFK